MKDEVSLKRNEKWLKENNNIIAYILNIINSKAKILKNQESFKINSLQNLQRMKELLNDLYEDETIVLTTLYNDKKHTSKSNYLTIFKVEDHKKLFDILHQILIDCLGKNYTLTVEELMFPTCLSFKNDNLTLYLLNLDSTVVNV